MNDDELNYLMESYSTLLEGVEFRNGTVIFDRYARVEFCSEQYCFLDSRSERSSYVIACNLLGVGGQINPDTSDARPVVVQYYMKQNTFASNFSGKPLSWLMSLGLRNTQTDISARVEPLKFGVRTF